MAKSTSPPPRSQETPKQEERSSNVPVFTARHRALKAAVWTNNTENGPMFNTTVTRSYKEKDQWHESGSFSYDDILIVAELLRMCHGFISREFTKSGNDSKAQ